LPVTIRTLDLGADKADSTGIVLDDEDNPALGVRGVRLSLRRPQLMIMQLRAILRASNYGPVRVLVPMVASAEEMASVRHLLNECARDLRTSGYEIADHIELGAMIEVPAAAIALPGMIKRLDFIAIGTNDLVQYTLGLDRAQPLATARSAADPEVLQLIADTVAAAHEAGLTVEVCGESASVPELATLYVGLGVDELSVAPARLDEIRTTVRRISAEESAGLAWAALSGERRNEQGKAVGGLGGVHA